MTVLLPRSALLASYRVADRIAKGKIPHNITDGLILPAAVHMLSIMVSESVGNWF